MKLGSKSMAQSLRDAAKLYRDASLAMGKAGWAAREVGESDVKDALLEIAGRYSRIWIDLEKMADEFDRANRASVDKMIDEINDFA